MYTLRRIAGLLLTGVAALALASCATPSTSGSTQSSTPTASAAPSATSPSVDTAGVVAFDADCAKAMTDEEVSAAFGRDMVLLIPPWAAPEVRVLGGLTCTWSTPDAYAAETLTLTVLPDAVVPEEFRVGSSEPVCEPAPGWAEGAEPCLASAAVGAAFYRLWASPGLSGPEALGRLQAAVVERVGAYPEPAAAVRQPDWWTVPECADLTAAVPATSLGFSSAELQPLVEADPTTLGSLLEKSGASRLCQWSLIPATGEDWYPTLTVSVVPGGGEYFPDIAASDGAQPVDVPGATAAVIVLDDDLFEGQFPPLVATDGVNIVLVAGDPTVDPADLTGWGALMLETLSG